MKSLMLKTAPLFVISDEFKCFTVWCLEDTLSRSFLNASPCSHSFIHLSTQSLFHYCSWEVVSCLKLILPLLRLILEHYMENTSLKMRGLLIHYIFVQVFFKVPVSTLPPILYIYISGLCFLRYSML